MYWSKSTLVSEKSPPVGSNWSQEFRGTFPLRDEPSDVFCFTEATSNFAVPPAAISHAGTDEDETDLSTDWPRRKDDDANIEAPTAINDTSGRNGRNSFTKSPRKTRQSFEREKEMRLVVYTLKSEAHCKQIQQIFSMSTMHESRMQTAECIEDSGDQDLVQSALTGMCVSISGAPSRPE